jgi:hypothetical protein
MTFTAIRFAALLAVTIAAPLTSGLDDHLMNSAELPNQATILSGSVQDTSTVEPACNPLAAVGDVLSAVPVFLNAHGGFNSALEGAVASLDACTIQYFGEIILGAGQSPLGSLCR